MSISTRLPTGTQDSILIRPDYWTGTLHSVRCYIGDMSLNLLETALVLRQLSDDLAEIAYGNVPGGSAELPILHRWALATHEVPHIVGHSEDHPILGDRPISTSQLYFISEELGLARTLSRWYRLGEPLDLAHEEGKH